MCYCSTSIHPKSPCDAGNTFNYISDVFGFAQQFQFQDFQIRLCGNYIDKFNFVIS